MALLLDIATFLGFHLQHSIQMLPARCRSTTSAVDNKADLLSRESDMETLPPVLSDEEKDRRIRAIV